jgi:hypothetical protein
LVAAAQLCSEASTLGKHGGAAAPGECRDLGPVDDDTVRDVDEPGRDLGPSDVDSDCERHVPEFKFSLASLYSLVSSALQGDRESSLRREP